ncbi:MAG: D-alanyl-D-alanine carboxypeptidase [Clostridia bacterium]|nr:D-alanyl-D-alanine carboxypeptidase [Clostridia bacterium]
MRRNLFLALFFAILFTLAYSVNAIELSAKGAVLLEADSGDIVFGKNENERLPMASTTKIMTALVVLERVSLDTVVTIQPFMTGIEGSSIYLHEGEELTVEELLYALMLESANDASVALAYTVADSIEEFADLMNKRAVQLGLTDTHFSNPHGLDDKEHYTTAYELAVITREAMKNPKFEEIVSTYKKTIPLNNGEGARVLVNHNRLLRSYEGAIGVKTGFTKRCGRCLVSCAVLDGVKMICVTLNAPNDWSDHASMLDLGFSQYRCIKLADKNDYNIRFDAINGVTGSFIASNRDSLSVTIKNDDNNISAKLESSRIFFAPIKKGDLVAKIVFYNGERELASLPLYACESIDGIKYKKSIFERLFG